MVIQNASALFASHSSNVFGKFVWSSIFTTNLHFIPAQVRSTFIAISLAYNDRYTRLEFLSQKERTAEHDHDELFKIFLRYAHVQANDDR